MTEIKRISPADRDTDVIFDVVFLHGLDGDALQTWTVPKTNDCWPYWLAEHTPRAAVWSVDFDAWSRRSKGHAMGLFDRAINILSALNNHGIGERPLCFITHSMGGLLAKKLVLLATSRDEFQHIATMSKGFVFIATPHTGASLANVANLLRVAVRPTEATHDLQKNAPQLRELNDDFRNWVAKSGGAVLAFFEKLPIMNVLVVDEASANPGIAQVSPRGVDADHLSICKPTSQRSFLYQEVRLFIRKFGTASAELNTPVHVEEPAPSPKNDLKQDARFDLSGSSWAGGFSVDNSKHIHYTGGRPVTDDVAVHVVADGEVELAPNDAVTLRVDVLNNSYQRKEVVLRTIGRVPPESCSLADEVLPLEPRTGRSTELTIRCESPYPPPDVRELRIDATEGGGGDLVKAESDPVRVRFLAKPAAAFGAARVARSGRTDKYVVSVFLENCGNISISGRVRLADHDLVVPGSFEPEVVSDLQPGKRRDVRIEFRIPEQPLARQRDLYLSLLFATDPEDDPLARSSAIPVNQTSMLTDLRDGIAEAAKRGRHLINESRRWAGELRTAKQGKLLLGAVSILVLGVFVGASFPAGTADASSPARDTNTATPSTGNIAAAPLPAHVFQSMPCTQDPYVTFLATLKDGDDLHTKYIWNDLNARAQRMAKPDKGIPHHTIKVSKWNDICEVARKQHIPDNPQGDPSWRVVWVGPTPSSAAAGKICQDLAYSAQDCVTREVR